LFLFIVKINGSSVSRLMEGNLPEQSLIINGAGYISLVIPFHDSTCKLKRCGQAG
jgi:hypothetical protein